MSTVHKVQGSTKDRLVISLTKRPTKPSREDYHQIYVALSRVKVGSNFRVFCPTTPEHNLDFINSLKPPLELQAFLHGYDGNNSKWNRQRAEDKLVDLKEAEAEYRRAASGQGRGQRQPARGRGRR